MGEGPERQSPKPGGPRGTLANQGWQQLGLNLVWVSLRLLSFLWMKILDSKAVITDDGGVLCSGLSGWGGGVSCPPSQLPQHHHPPALRPRPSWTRLLGPEDSRPACWRLPPEYLQGVDSAITLDPQASPTATEQKIRIHGESPGRKVCSCATSGACLALTTHSGHRAPEGTVQVPLLVLSVALAEALPASCSSLPQVLQLMV